MSTLLSTFCAVQSWLDYESSGHSFSIVHAGDLSTDSVEVVHLGYRLREYML